MLNWEVLQFDTPLFFNLSGGIWNEYRSMMKYRTLILFGFIALKFLLQIVLLNPAYELHRDEFLHLDQANHLAWGFSTIPPFTSWTSYLIDLLGGSVFWIKFFPALYGALTIYIVWKAIEELDGTIFALILGSTCILLSALLRINTLYQPNSFDILCWTAVYYVILKYVKSQDSSWLYWAAAIAAIGFLNKYNIVFLVLGMIPGLLLTPERRIFTRPALYIAMGIGLALILPNLVWQYQNSFPVFHHLRELADHHLIHVNRMDFLKTQFIFYPGGILVLPFAFYALLFYAPYRPYRFFFWSFIFTMAIFMYFKAKDYYAIGVYPIYLAFGAAFLGKLVKEGWKRYIQPLLLAFPIALFIPILQVAFPNKSPGYIAQHPENYKKFGMLRWEDGKDHPIPQDFADMLGWKELASKVDSVHSTLSGATLVLCDNYGQAGAINFYTQREIRAVSFHADYLYWFDLSKTYRNLIRVVHKEDAKGEFQEVSSLFHHSVVADSITHTYARENGTKILAFEDAKFDLRNRLMEEIEEEKKR